MLLLTFDWPYDVYAYLLVSLGVFALVWALRRVLSVCKNAKQGHGHASPSFQKRGLSSKDSHVDTFPPSQRRLLAQASSAFDNNEAPIEQPALSSRLLRMNEDYDAVAQDRTLFSGFSVSDVVALGVFPDYATLSEVPLPEPLNDFDINTAQGRPYRPLRWPYHQTMGNNSTSFFFS